MYFTWKVLQKFQAQKYFLHVKTKRNFSNAPLPPSQKEQKNKATFTKDPI